MSRRAPLRSEEGRRLVERGPAWREHPDYYADEPDDCEPIPWFTEKDATEAAERMKAWAKGQAKALGVTSLWDLTDEDWLNFARVALELRPR